jgi:hypothetical protein
VIGVFGTSGDTTGAACELNNPCELNPDGSVVAAHKDQNYAHFVHEFYGCLNRDGDVDLAVPGCRLPKSR